MIRRKQSGPESRASLWRTDIHQVDDDNASH